METVTFAEIQKVKSSFEFKNSISSTRNCNEFRFFEPRFTSLVLPCSCIPCLVAFVSYPADIDLGVTPIYFSHLLGKKSCSLSCSLGLTSVPLEIGKSSVETYM